MTSLFQPASKPSLTGMLPFPSFDLGFSTDAPPPPCGKRLWYTGPSRAQKHSFRTPPDWCPAGSGRLQTSALPRMPTAFEDKAVHYGSRSLYGSRKYWQVGLGPSSDVRTWSRAERVTAGFI